MRFAALLERTPTGWRAWVPALPGVEVEARTSAGAEEDLAAAVERRLREHGASTEELPEIRGFTIEVSLRGPQPVRRPLERQGEDEKRRTLRRLDGVMQEGARLPQELMNAVFEYRREIRDTLPEEPLPTDDDGGDDLPPNVVRFAPREV